MIHVYLGTNVSTILYIDTNISKYARRRIIHETTIMIMSMVNGL